MPISPVPSFGVFDIMDIYSGIPAASPTFPEYRSCYPATINIVNFSNSITQVPKLFGTCH